MALTVATSLIESLRAEAARAAPHECCGLLLGGEGRIDVILPAGNVARDQAEAAGLPLVAPPIRLCTDNAVMVAWAGIERLRAGLTDSWDHAPRPRWPLLQTT